MVSVKSYNCVQIQSVEIFCPMYQHGWNNYCEAKQKRCFYSCGVTIGILICKVPESCIDTHSNNWTTMASNVW